MTPSTSVQIWTSSAASAAPRIVAVKSLPERPSVVMLPAWPRAMKPVTIGTSWIASIPARTSGKQSGSGVASPWRSSVRSPMSNASTARLGIPWAVR